MKRGCLLVLWLACMLVQAQTEQTHPNVLLVVLDDAGYSDVAGFGRDDAPTPNLEKLAQEGVRFTRHYADSTCRPARLALITGQESARIAQNPDFRGIPPERVTLAEALKAQGYQTHHIGKWHLGDSVRESWPDRHGFDSWFGFLNQFQLKGPDAEGNFTKRPTYTDPFLQSDDQPLRQHKGHLEDILTNRVIQRVRSEAGASAKPWFINWWMFAPHHPTTASPEWLKRFPDSPAGKYQALLAQADHNIGEVLKTLKDTGQLDHTLVIVVSDNGGTNQMMHNNAPFAGVKGEFKEGSLRTPLIVRWPDHRNAGETRDAIVAIQDIYPTVLETMGIPVPAGLDGQSLQPLLKVASGKPRTLIHELMVPGAFGFSYLSEDGHWRLTEDGLYDLVAQPAGGSLHVAKEEQQRLQTAYLGWRHDKIRVPVTVRTTPTGWEATGEDFRRAPGYGAYSFAVGLRWPLPESGTLVSQQGIWSLSIGADHTLDLKIGAQSIRSTPLPDTLLKSGACLPLVLSTYFSRSRLYEGKNYGLIHLYANGRQILEQQLQNPEEIEGNLNQSTRAASGVLVSPPLFFNAALGPDDGSEWQDSPVQAVGDDVCAALPPQMR